MPALTRRRYSGRSVYYGYAQGGPVRMKNCLTFGFCIALAACSSESRLPPEVPPAPPDISKAIPNIRDVAKEFHLTAQLQVAGPFNAPANYDNPYIICVKSPAQPRFTIALFYKGDKYVSSRTAIMPDGCDSAPYQALPESPPPPEPAADQPHRGKRKPKRDE